MKKFLALMLSILMLVTLCGCALVSDTGTDAGTDANKNDNAAAKQDKVKVIDVALSEEAYAFCVGKDDATLLKSVNDYLKKIKGDGTFDAICDKYFGDGTPAQITSAAEDKNKDQLIVATSTGFEPFEMVEGGKYSGIDLEIADGLAKYLGKELVIKDMQFDAVVTSVQQGICDIGMAGLTITPAREEVVTFSDSYYSANQVLIVPAKNTEFDACTTAEDVVKILKTKTAAKIGCQKGTTGAIYIAGDKDDPDGYGFEGLPGTKMEYDYAALAVQSMINGEIDYVVVDNAPANAIAKAVNR